MVDNDVYACGDVNSDQNKTKVEVQQDEAAMQENDVYEGGDVMAEYDVYTGSRGANWNSGNLELPKESSELREDDPYDFYKGSTTVGCQHNTGDITDDVVMTENDVYVRD